MTTIALLLLAAGSSSRMGRSKQLLPIEGKPLLLKSVEAALGTDAAKTIVVLGASEAEHRKVIDHLPIDIISNPGWEKGMGTSLRTGLNYAINNIPKLASVLILVCDQPFLTSHHLNTLIRTQQTSGKPIVASAYAGTTGVPALFDKSFFQKLIDLKDNQGARKLIMDEPGSMLSVDFPQGSVDLDTLQDYETLLRSFDQSKGAGGRS